MQLIIGAYLVLLGIRDIIKRKIPILWLVAGFCVLVSLGIYRCTQGQLGLMDILIGVMPGIILLLVARFSGKAGTADGIVLVQLGLCLGYRESIFLLCFSLLLLSVVSVILLILHKVHKNTKIPYLPFLATVYLLQLL